jgi:hypothetical protein
MRLSVSARAVLGDEDALYSAQALHRKPGKLQGLQVVLESGDCVEPLR